MGILIQGPWKKRENIGSTTPTEGELTSVEVSKRYPWYALSGPKGTKPAEYSKMLAELKHLVAVAGEDAQLLLPKGWFWDPDKVQTLINELNQIGQEDELPDDCA